MLPYPRRWQINPPAVSAYFDILPEHFFTIDLKLDLAANNSLILSFYRPFSDYHVPP